LFLCDTGGLGSAARAAFRSERRLISYTTYVAWYSRWRYMLNMSLRFLCGIRSGTPLQKRLRIEKRRMVCSARGMTVNNSYVLVGR
jgi:hypothetical protein